MTKFKQLTKSEITNLLTIEDFKTNVENGSLNKFEGYACYATLDKVSDMLVDFSDVLNDHQPEWSTHVCWYDK